MSQPTSQKVSSQEALQTERYLWMARAFAAVGILSITANLLLLIAIFSLQPLVRIQPFYLRIYDKNQQVIEIEKPAAEVLKFEYLIESLIRQYIEARYHIGSDLAEVEQRWGGEGLVRLMSSTSAYNSFYTNQASYLLPEIRKQALTLEVNILNVNKLSEGRNNSSVWKVDFKTTQVTQSSQNPEITCWEANLEVDFSPSSNRRSWRERLKNPLGFTVEQYGVKKIECQKI